MQVTRKHMAAPLLLSIVFGLAACGNMMVKKEASLFDRLGGKDAIISVVDDFVANVAADGRINRYFAKADIPRLKQLLVEQICHASGGPCTYSGRDMQTTHKGMNITDAAFDYLVEDLVKSLDKFKVAEKEKNDLLTPLAAMKPAIVGQ